MNARTLALLAWLSFAAGASLRHAGQPEPGNLLVGVATVAYLAAQLRSRGNR